MKNSLDLKRFHVRSVLYASLKMKHQYTFFMGALKRICSRKRNSKNKNRSSCN